MLGSTIDYYLLRPFTHNRNCETEEQIEARHAHTSVDLDAALRRIDKLQRRLDGRFPIDPALRYLDVGCGIGDMALALARLGARHVTGIDYVPRGIAVARANAERLGLADRVDFVVNDIHDWEPEDAYDVVLSHEALEHISDPRAFLARLRRFTRPDGIAVLAFGPLFHSPVGDHMWGFFRVNIPWRGVMFSEQALLRLRRERFRPTDGAKRYGEVVGGLNLMRYSEFLKYTHEAGWKFDFLDLNPQLKSIPPAYWLSRTLCAIAGVRDYFATAVYAVLRPDRAAVIQETADRTVAGADTCSRQPTAAHL
ncbi:MAG TPA: class I SAM-dependent methyltransferase [Bryobacteraceae bacterium]|nr:class I SAM-dependent methyltransferase [Bryobacteraceae bacterium]